MLLYRQVRRAGHEGIEHVNNLSRALPRHHVLVKITEILEFLRDGLKVKLAARVLFYFATLCYVYTKLFTKELADLCEK